MWFWQVDTLEEPDFQFLSCVYRYLLLPRGIYLQVPSADRWPWTPPPAQGHRTGPRVLEAAPEPVFLLPIPPSFLLPFLSFLYPMLSVSPSLFLLPPLHLSLTLTSLVLSPFFFLSSFSTFPVIHWSISFVSFSPNHLIQADSVGERVRVSVVK